MASDGLMDAEHVRFPCRCSCNPACGCECHKQLPDAARKVCEEIKQMARAADSGGEFTITAAGLRELAAVLERAMEGR